MVRRSLSFFLLVSLGYLMSIIFPNALFAHHEEYRNFKIYSDQPISENINLVIDDALARIENSELYREDFQFNVYLANDHWRYNYFTRNPSSGGVVNFLFSPNIFIRENDINKNQLIPPGNWKNPLEGRPLSYFIAHESIHSLQREVSPFLVATCPFEILEGYADYMAKKNFTSLKELIIDFKSNSDNMNPEDGLYDLYHLYTRYLIEEKGYDFEQLVEEKPNLNGVLKKIDNSYTIHELI